MVTIIEEVPEGTESVPLAVDVLGVPAEKETV